MSEKQCFLPLKIHVEGEKYTHTHTSRETHTHSKASVFAGLYRKVNICINITVESVCG